MMKEMRTDLAKRLLRQFIEIATEALYSEQFDMESIVTRLSRGQTGVPLLRAYVAIQIAARLTEPLADADVDRAFHAVHLCEVYSESPVFRDILDVHKGLAEIYWLNQHHAIIRGKYYSQADEYSYEGVLYRAQYNKQGPLPREEQANLETLCKDMADSNHRFEQKELDLWKEQDDEEYQRYKEELEVRTLRREIDATEDQTIRLMIAEVVSVLEAKLNALLQNGKATA
jgi:hypothetical protein